MTKRLRLKITVGTALILGAFLLVLGIYTINSQKLQLINHLRDHGNHIANLAARSSAEYIQRFSFFLMEDQAMSIEQSDDIAFCEIYDAQGAPLLQSGNIISEDHQGKNTARYDDNIMIVSQPIVAEGTVLGRVEIGMKLDGVEQAIKEKTNHLVLLFSGFTICVILVLNLFFHKLFTKPVLSLVEGTQRIAKQDFATIDVGPRQDEIGLLAKNFNEMSRSLQGLYDNLEGKVKERTQALEQVNAELMVAIDQAKEMAKKAEEGTIAKSQFLASMSHEIRTPMNAVLGMGEILNGSDLSDEQRRYVSILLESGNALLGLIDDILDLSKIEAGEMTFENTPFDVEEVVSKAFKVTAYAGHQKGLDLDYSIAPGVPTELIGDPLRLQQILINLIGNGIKFTDTGSVLLDISVDPGNTLRPSDRLMIMFCVRDSGMGIESDKLGTIFEKFTQADASTTRRHGGTGLGLSICKLLCEKLGGRIWIESVYGHGSSVFFALPYQIQDHDQAPEFSLADQSFLFIDDREYAATTLASRLEKGGAHVMVETRMDGIRNTLQSARESGTRFDAVFLNTPFAGEEWGPATASLIDAGIGPDTIALMLPSDVADAGFMNAFGATLTKPVSTLEAMAAVDKILSQNSLDARQSYEAVEPAKTGLTILLVEDSKANSMLVELYLKDSEHRLLIAKDGAAGLALYESEDVDIVFMDIEMPVMDGYECTRKLREWEAANGKKPVKIVALTAHALSEVRAQISAAGCDTFLTKPISRANFLQELGDSADSDLLK